MSAHALLHLRRTKQRYFATADFGDVLNMKTMYKGVLRDDERRKEKMKQRQLEFEESQRKRALYESVQKVETEGAIPSGASR